MGETATLSREADPAGEPVVQGTVPGEPFDPLKAAVWAALAPFREELVSTGGVTFMGLRNAVVAAVRGLPASEGGRRPRDQEDRALRDDLTALRSQFVHLEARHMRLLIAFHDAIRRPLGVTPDSGLEFYDQRMADEAEERRPRRTPFGGQSL